MLPKFGLDPPEWKEVQRLRQLGLIDQADAVEAHFKSGAGLPSAAVVPGFAVAAPFRHEAPANEP